MSTPRTAPGPAVARDAGMRPFRALLVMDHGDDATAVREALRALPEAHAIDDETPVARLVPRALRTQPDVVLLGLGRPVQDALEALERIVTVAPQFPVVVLVRPGDEPAAIEAVRLGAQDYLPQDSLPPHELGRVLRCALERHRHLSELREQSWTDPLTGLHNRRGFAALAESHLRLARRNGRRVLVLCTDLDGLKAINDRHGHEEGDRAIVRAAQLLRRALRESDVVARFGGDEFVALAHDADVGSLEALRRRIEARFEAEHARTPRAYRLSLSLGAASMDAGGASLTELLARADEDLYRAKRRRRAAASRAAPGRAARAAGAAGGAAPLLPAFARTPRR